MTSILGLQGVQSVQAGQCNGGNNVVNAQICNNNICANVGVNAEGIAQGAQNLRQDNNCPQ
jgi:hypothetical protein